MQRSELVRSSIHRNSLVAGALRVCALFAVLLSALLLSTLLLPHSRAQADQSSPEGVIAEMTSRLKSSRDPVVILDYVHWPSAYAAYPEDQKRLQNLVSPEALATHMKGALGDPEHYLKEQFESRAQRMPPELATKLRASSDALVESMRQVRAHIQERIGDTTYRVVRSESVSPERARVILAITLGEETKESTIELQRIEGRWYLPTIDFARDEGGSL